MVDAVSSTPSQSSPPPAQQSTPPPQQEQADIRVDQQPVQRTEAPREDAPANDQQEQQRSSDPSDQLGRQIDIKA
jgi:hypothetical protein